MKVILSGGGTGGHVYPALAIAFALKEKIPSVEYLYVGTSKGFEAELVPRYGIEFASVNVEGLPRKMSFRFFSSAVKLGRGIWESKKILDNFSPKLIIATGGYACGPIAFLAARRGVKLIVHEQNVVPGLTNRVLAKKADLICATFKDSLKYFPKNKNIVVTGLPVRPEIISTSRKEGAEKLGIDPAKFIILIVGGSRGAEKINEAMLDVIKYYGNDPNIQIVHVTGEAGYERFLSNLDEAKITEKLKNVYIVPYMHEINNALGCADLVIGRAGASFISELTAKGVAAVLIPYPYASNNHQEYNALSLVRNNAAVMIKDGDLNGQVLLEEIKGIIRNKDILNKMKLNSKSIGITDAAEKITFLIEDMIRKNNILED